MYRNNYNQQVRAYNKMVKVFPRPVFAEGNELSETDTTYTDYDAPEDAPQNLFGDGGDED